MAADNRRLSRLSIGVSGSSVSRQSLGAPRLSISGRRSSLKGGRPSLAPDPNRRLSTVGKPAPVTRVHDPRPIGDKAFTKANIAILIPFLVKNQYDRPISPKTLQYDSIQNSLALVAFGFRCRSLLSLQHSNITFHSWQYYCQCHFCSLIVIKVLVSLFLQEPVKEGLPLHCRIPRASN